MIKHHQSLKATHISTSKIHKSTVQKLPWYLSHSHTYMVTDDRLNNKTAKHYETLMNLRHAAFREQSQNNYVLYEEMQYLPGPTHV